MTTNTNRKLAKGFWPVLLLSAALSLPAASVAAPSAHGKAHAADKHNEKREQRPQKQVVRQQKQVAHQQKQVERQVRQLRKVQRQQTSREQRAWAAQQAEARRQALRNRDNRAPANKVHRAPVVVRPTRNAYRAPAPVYVNRAPVYVAQRNNRRSWDGWNRRYNKYGSGAFQLDGTFVDQQYGCVLVRDHQGQVIPLVGNPGDLRRGEHVLLSGRIQNNTSCGTAFRVDSVDRVWADAGHRRVLFDRRQDGEYYDQSGGRYGRNSRERYDDRYDRYDDRYNDNGDGRRTISVDGRLDDSGDCPVIRGDRGEYYDLVGDLRNFRDGRHVRVIGRDGIRSECGGPAIEVGEIINR